MAAALEHQVVRTRLLGLPLSCATLVAVLGCRAPQEGDPAVQIEARAVPGGFPVPVRALAWSPDGTLLLAGDHEGRIHRFELATGQVQTVWTGHAGPISGLAQRLDGTIASFGRDGAFRITDPQRHGTPGSARAPRSPITAALYAAAGDQTLAWEGVETRAGAPTFCSPRPAVLTLRSGAGASPTLLSHRANCAAFSAGGRFAVWVEAEAVHLYEIGAGRAPVAVPLADAPDTQGLSVSDDGARIAVAVRGELRLVDPAAGRVAANVGRLVLSGQPLPVRFTPDGTGLVALLPDLVETGRLNLDLLDATTLEVRHRLMANAPDELAGVEISPDGATVAVAETAGRIHRIRVPSGERLPELSPHHWLGGGIAVSTDGRHVATCWQTTYHIRDAASGDLLVRMDIPGQSCTVEHAFAVDPTGARILPSADVDAPFAAYGTDGLAAATYDRPPDTTVHRPVYARNGRWVAALVVRADQARFFVWPAEGGAPSGDVLLPPMRGLRSVVVTDDGRTVYASFGHIRTDGTVVGELAAFRIGQPAAPLWARADPAFADLGQVVLTPGDATLLFSSGSDEVQVVDPATGEPLRALVNSAETVWTFSRFGTVGVFSMRPVLERPVPRPPRSYATALAVDGAGRHVAVAGYNRSNQAQLLEIFDLSSGDLLAVTRVLATPRALFFDDGALLAPGLPGGGGDLTRLRLGE